MPSTHGSFNDVGMIPRTGRRRLLNEGKNQAIYRSLFYKRHRFVVSFFEIQELTSNKSGEKHMEDSNNPVEERLNASMSASGSSFMYSDSVGSWFLTILLLCLPIVNFVYLAILVFGVGGSVAKINMARATLIWMVIAAIAYFGFFAFLFGMGN